MISKKNRITAPSRDGQFVYILRCGDGSLYTGWTTNLAKRLSTHQAGKGAKYTKSHLPVELVYFETFESKQEAQAREYAIKKLTKEQKEQLVQTGASGKAVKAMDTTIPSGDLPLHLTRSRTSGESKDFLLRRCTEEDAEAILALQDRVHDFLPNKDFMKKLTREELLESLTQDYGFCFMEGDRLAAFTMMVGPCVSYRNAGTALDYTEEELKKTVSMDISFVDPDYRGFGLQKEFFSLREDAARSLGATQCLTTIAPDNAYSLNNALRSGYEEVTRAKLYGGLDRIILRKYL